jgi:hypothetical protein
MANLHRGEIDAEFDGRSRTLCLTLGALAELEAAYGGADLLATAQRFEAGNITASDCIKVIGAGLRGAGHAVTDAEVAAMRIEGGAAGALAIVVRLLKATFAP